MLSDKISLNEVYKMSETWVLPTTVFNLVDGLVGVGKQTDEDLKKKRQFGKLREAWIASVFLLRKISLEKRLWYLKKNDIENSSDDIFARPFALADGAIWSEDPLPIQAFQITEKSPSVYNSLDDKFQDDLTGVSLVGYVLRDENLDWREINQHITTKKPRVKDVHLIGNIGPATYIVSEVFPKISTVIVGIRLCILNGKPILEATRVYKKSDSGTTYLGKSLVTPTMDIVSEK